MASFCLSYLPLRTLWTSHFKDLWNKLAEKEGLKGFHFVGLTENFRLHTSDGQIRNVFSPKDASGDYYNHILSLGFDAVNSRGGNGAQVKSDSPLIYYLKRFIQNKLHIDYVLHIDYAKIIRNYYVEKRQNGKRIPNHYPEF